MVGVRMLHVHLVSLPILRKIARCQNSRFSLFLRPCLRSLCLHFLCLRSHILHSSTLATSPHGGRRHAAPHAAHTTWPRHVHHHEGARLLGHDDKRSHH